MELWNLVPAWNFGTWFLLGTLVLVRNCATPGTLELGTNLELLIAVRNSGTLGTLEGISYHMCGVSHVGYDPQGYWTRSSKERITFMSL